MVEVVGTAAAALVAAITAAVATTLPAPGTAAGLGTRLPSAQAWLAPL
jgi:hypothetical protein